MPLTLFDLEKWAIEAFQAKFYEGKGDTDDDEASDLISEIADSLIPIYTYQVLEVAMSDLRLVCDFPEFHFSHWKSTPLELIQYNIFEHLRGKLLEWYYNNKNN